MITILEQQEIEKEALELYPKAILPAFGKVPAFDLNKPKRIIWIAGATVMVERKNAEIEKLKEWHEYYKDRAEKGESILKSATDIHFIPGKEGDNLLAAKDRELEQLKEEIKRLDKEIDTYRDALELDPINRNRNET